MSDPELSDLDSLLGRDQFVEIEPERVFYRRKKKKRYSFFLKNYLFIKLFELTSHNVKYTSIIYIHCRHICNKPLKKIFKKKKA
jgi:hypothetical protein